jgi:hypothetical protein
MKEWLAGVGGIEPRDGEFQKSLLPGGLIRNRRLSPIREIRQLLSGEAHKRLKMIGFQGSY